MLQNHYVMHQNAYFFIFQIWIFDEVRNVCNFGEISPVLSTLPTPLCELCIALKMELSMQYKNAWCCLLVTLKHP